MLYCEAVVLRADDGLGPASVYKCAECETTFPSLDSLETHMMTHLGNSVSYYQFDTVCD